MWQYLALLPAWPRGPHLRRWAPRLVKLSLSLLLLSVLCWWHDVEGLLADKAGQVFALGAVTLDVPVGGKPAEVGWPELMQLPGADSAEQSHIVIEAVAGPDGAPHVSLRNFARQKRLFLRFSDGSAGDADRWALTPNGTNTVTIGRTVLAFSEISAEGFRLSVGTGAQAPRDFAFRLGGGNGRLVEAGSAQPGECQPEATHWLHRLLADAGDAVRHAWPWPAPHLVLDIGGPLVCRNADIWQIVAPDLDWRAFSVLYSPAERRFYLTADDPQYRSDRLTAFRTDAGEIAGFSGIRWTLDADVPHVTGFIAGRTAYAITTQPVGIEAAAVSGAGVPPAGGRDARPTVLRHVRVTITPVEGGRVPIFSDAPNRCGWLRRGLERPEGAPELAADCPAAVPPGVTVSPPFALLDRYVDGNTQALSSGERLVRWMLLGLAIGLAGLLSPVRAVVAVWWLQRRAASWRRSLPALWSGLAPVLLTVLAAMLAILPGLASAQGSSLGAGGARAVLLADWFLAGLALIGFGSGVALGGFWILVTIIAAIGSISLTSLALDGDSTYWVGFAMRHKLLFLDLVPPFVIVAATVPLTSVRPILQELVIGNRRGAVYVALRWLPMAALFAAFAVWLAIGDQQGVGGFQPVEAGKFAALLLIGVPLVGFARAARRLATRPGRASKTAALAAVLGLLLVLLVVPVLRSDYSPALILGLLLLALISLHFLPDAIAGTVAYLRVSAERRRVPLRFRPPVRRPGERWRRLWVPGAVVLALGLAAILPFRTGWAVASLLQMEPASWSADRDETLQRLEDALGRSDRFVPVERFITWYDLAYPDAGSTGRAVAHFRDLDFQVVRSRIVIGHAPCRSETFFPDDAAGWSPARLVSSLFAGVVGQSEALLGWFVPHAALCQTPPARDAAADRQIAAVGGPQRRSMLDDTAPNHIPVVQSDFAAAYLIGRHGLEAAAVLIAAQGLLLMLILYTWHRLRASLKGESADRVVRHLLSIFLAGAGLLLALQWLISWANVLGLLPVMGQPMTFLAAGTSHHLGMALPCLLTIVLAIRYSLSEKAFRPLRAPPPQL